MYTHMERTESFEGLQDSGETLMSNTYVPIHQFIFPLARGVMWELGVSEGPLVAKMHYAKFCDVWARSKLIFP